MTTPLMQPDLCARRAREGARRDAARRARYRYLATEDRGSWIAAERRRWRRERIRGAVRRGVLWLLAGVIAGEAVRWIGGG